VPRFDGGIVARLSPLRLFILRFSHFLTVHHKAATVITTFQLHIHAPPLRSISNRASRTAPLPVVRSFSVLAPLQIFEKGKLRDGSRTLQKQGLRRPVFLSHHRDVKYSYTRLSTDDQTPALQLAALRKAGCKRIFKDDGLSGGAVKRPALTGCLKKLQQGDTLIVWELDYLGRSLRDLITVLDDLRARGVKFRSLPEAIDTDTPTG
jgi:hypothetical protein